MQGNNQAQQPLSFNYVYERQLYQRCKRCNECVKAIIFTEIIVTLISLLFYSVVFAMSFTKQEKLSYHLIILTFSGVTVFAYVVCFLILKRNFPSEQTASCKRIFILYFEVVLLLTLAGALILSKLIIDFLMIVDINKDRDKTQVNYDWLLFYLDFLFSIIGLQLITTLFSILNLLCFIAAIFFTFIHAVLWLCSGKKRSLISNLLSSIEKVIQERKYKWQRFLKQFKSEIPEVQNREEGCPICCEEFSPGQLIYELPCIEGKPLHFFHTTCLDIWSRSSAACPTCRTPFSRLVKT